MRLLTPQQTKLLELFAQEKMLCEGFYLSGGTALTSFYIPYRYSNDLDFFSKQEVDPLGITICIKKWQKDLNFNDFETITSFNRNLYYLNFTGDYVLKLEFTYYPFEQIKAPKKIGGVSVDSTIDIAVNKLFTIYQKPATRHYMDLYMLCERYHYSVEDLKQKARVKFDTVIDNFQLGSQFLRAAEVSDYPRLTKKLNDSKWQKFFEKEASRLKKDVSTH